MILDVDDSSITSTISRSGPVEFADTSTRSERSGRHVSFNTMAEVCLLEPPPSNDEESTGTDSSELWWTSNDYENNKRKHKSLARRMLSSSLSALPDPNDVDEDADGSYRGLERLLDGGYCKARMRRVIRVVRGEQARHFLDGVEGEASDLAIAQVYGALCVKSVNQAKRLGRFDAMEARKALEDNWEDDDATASTSTSASVEDSSASLLLEESEESPAIDCDRGQVEEPINNENDNATPIVAVNSKTKGKLWSGRLSLRTNYKFSMSNVMNRRPHAWI